MTFPTRVDYTNFDEITVRLKLITFAEPEEFPINVVGRVGFLDHLQIGLVDYEQLLYLGPYETA